MGGKETVTREPSPVISLQGAGEEALAHEPLPVISLKSAKEEFLEHLPIWFVYLEAVGLLHAALANFPEAGFRSLGIPRSYFIPTLLFPLPWLFAYFWMRIRHSPRLQSPWRAYVALAIMLVVVPLVTILGYRPHPLSYKQLTIVFEATQYFWVLLFVVQILWARGRYALLMFFGVTFVYGLILENAGIVMHFFYEPRFHLYLGPLPAPLCTMLGWCLVFYVTVSVTQKLVGWAPWLGLTPWRRALVATTLALCLDAQLDPLASMSGVYWRWNELLPPAFLGVPLINFAAWFGAFLPYTYFVFKILDREDWTPRRQNWELFLRVPLAALLGGLICFGIMAIVEGGFSGPTFQILRLFGQRLLPY